MAPAHLLTLLSLLASAPAASAQLRRRAVDPSAVDPAAVASAAQAAAVVPAPTEEPPAELPGHADSLIAMQFTPDPYASRDPYDMLRTGELGLSAIRYMPYSFASSKGHGETYGDVHGEFCVFDTQLNKQDPARYPTAHAVMGQSEHCGEHRVTLPLSEVLVAVNKHDAQGKMKRLPVEGMVFHEGYSGAGLISNALSTFESNLVVSEHPALRDALAACDVINNRFKSDDCSASAHQALVQDVVTLLSRTKSNDETTKLYLKLSRDSTAYLPTIRSLYPDAKWAFVYRQATHALAKATAGRRKGACVKARRNPSKALAAKTAQEGLELESLSHHEVCALLLSMLMDVAREEHAASGTGMLVSYDEALVGNPDKLVGRILPYLGMQAEIEADPEGVTERVSEIMATRSNANGRANPDERRWNGEAVEVTEEVEGASRAYLSGAMDAMARQ